MAEPAAPAPSIRDEILGEQKAFDVFTLFVPAPDLPLEVDDNGAPVVNPPPTEDDLNAYRKLLEGQAADVEKNPPKDSTAEMLAVRAQHVAELRSLAASFDPKNYSRRTFKYRRPSVRERTKIQQLAGIKTTGSKKQIESQEFDPARFLVAVAIVTLCTEDGQPMFKETEFEALLDVSEEGLGGRAMAECMRRYNKANMSGKSSANRRNTGSSSPSRAS